VIAQQFGELGPLLVGYGPYKPLMVGKLRDIFCFILLRVRIPLEVWS
jgi:hypothetical protein